MKQKTDIKQKASRYLKIVEWSNEDDCFVGTCPGLFLGGCHGNDEVKVYKELTQMVEEVVEDMENNKIPLPPETINKEYSGKFVVRVSPEVHKKLAIKALVSHQSLNKYVTEVLSAV